MRRALLCALALLFSPGAARASGFLLFQHGGAAMGEAGALTARADDASAVFYNPAAIARLQGSHYQLGWEFSAPKDVYRSDRSGDWQANHVITQSPSVFASWHLPADYYPLAFGIGLESDAW